MCIYTIFFKMSSANLVDFLTEKIFSFSSKMKDESLQHYGTSYLMCGNNSTSHHWDPLKAINVLKENISDFEGNASFYPYILNQVLDILDSNHSFKFRQNLKPENLFSRSKIGFFSPHLLDLISDLNSYHYRNTYSDTSLVALNSIFLGNITNTLFNELPIMSQNPKVDFKSDTKSGNLPVNEVKMSLNLDQLPTDLLLQSPKMKQTSEASSFDTNAYSLPDTKSDNLSVNEVKMSLNIDQLPTDLLLQSPKIKQTSEASFNSYSSPVNAVTMSLDINQLPTHSDSLNEKCNLSTSVKLNLKLANRKTKQMNKRSKKRRRRQKKSLHSVNSNSDMLLGNGDTNGKSQSPVSSSVCFIAESPDFECKISFQHSVKVPSFVSSFVVPVENSSDDDSEWESYDEIDHCKYSNLANCKVLSSTDSSPSKSMEYKCSVPCMKSGSSIMSFVVPISNSSDDDSEWDTCEPDTSFETPDFEFTGLFLANLCTPRTLFPDKESKVCEASADETNESFQLKKILIEANKNWDNLTNGDTGLKSTSKVTFAPDEVLVEVFPVEMYERKGEWETYATERLRFKRKIDELEKVLSPCLHPEHRTKVFKKLMAVEL